MISALQQIIAAISDIFNFISNFFTSMFQNILAVTEFNNISITFLTDIVYSSAWGSVLGIGLMIVVSTVVLAFLRGLFSR